MTLAFIAAVWVAMQTAFVAMTAISLVFFGVSGYLHRRVGSEPEPSGNQELLASLAEGIAREEWVLRQPESNDHRHSKSSAPSGLQKSAHLPVWRQ